MPGVARRDLLTSLVSLPLASLLANPSLARAAAAGLAEVTIKTPGGKDVSAALAVPATTPAPAVLLIHEWWGLNEQIKTMAAELAREGYVALAVDLYGGKVASDAATAGALVKEVKAEEATDALGAWIDWLRGHQAVGPKVATLGWCFGGGWSLNASLTRPVEATIIYYGRVDKSPESLAPLKGPVLGHFALQDKGIKKEMVEGFEQAMAKAGKTLELHWYDADHAFANPTSARYDSGDAQLAWDRSLAFLAAQLQG